MLLKKKKKISFKEGFKEFAQGFKEGIVMFIALLVAFWVSAIYMLVPFILEHIPYDTSSLEILWWLASTYIFSMGLMMIIIRFHTAGEKSRDKRELAEWEDL